MAELTLDQLRLMLPCNKNRLDDELELQPDMMMRIATRLTTMMSRMMEAKDELARVEGRLTEDLKEDDPKLTVAGLEARVKRHGDRTKAWTRFQEARHDLELWQGMLESWRQKGYSLKTLSELYSAQYFSVNSTMDPKRREREDRQDNARAEMREAGQRASSREPSREEPRPSTRRRLNE